MNLIKSLFVFLSFVSKTQAAEDDHHADEHKCACEAEEFGFEINCTNTDAMIAAMTNLQTLGCSADCSSAECEKNFLIVQSHHDYCNDDEVPEVVEDGFHDYDEVCTHCAISQKSISGVAPCPAVTCDSSGNDAYAAAIDEGCENDCSSEECIKHYLILKTVHDTCDHDVLTQAAEEGLHDLEVPCAAHVCDTGVSDQLVCDDHEDHDHDHDHDHEEEEKTQPLGADSSAVRKSAIVVYAALLSMLV